LSATLSNILRKRKRGWRRSHSAWRSTPNHNVKTCCSAFLLTAICGKTSPSSLHGEQVPFVDCSPRETEVGKRSDNQSETLACGRVAHKPLSQQRARGCAQHHAHSIQLGDEMGIHRYRQDESYQPRQGRRFIETVETVENPFCEGVSVAS